jgi:FAD/FMN-containing dehydrogenase
VASADLAAHLARILGPGGLITDQALTSSYETDWTGRWHHRAALVARPRTTEEVSTVLRECRQTSTPVVPQGGNTGLVGGGVPREGCDVVLGLGLMTSVSRPDLTDMSLVAEAGASLASVQAAAASVGLEFGVDLAARDTATVGGMVATNAGGTHFLRNGAMREQVIALEAVTADGSVLGAVPGLSKDNTGYDLASLVCGSEGTLAVVTRVHLRLLPSPEERAVALLGFPTVSDAIAVLPALRGVPELSAVEFLDSHALRLVASHLRSTPPVRTADGGGCLLVEVAGPSGCSENLLDAVAVLGSGVDTAIATDHLSARRLWRWRDSAPDAISAVGTPHKLDVTVPPGRIAEFEGDLRALLAHAGPQATVLVFGHAADGNLHVNLLGLSPQDDTVDAEVLGLVARYGGSISAEHGIGVAKRDFLSLTRSARDIDLMRRIKQALDPAGILNPGVIFASSIP